LNASSIAFEVTHTLYVFSQFVQALHSRPLHLPKFLAKAYQIPESEMKVMNHMEIHCCFPSSIVKDLINFA